MAFNKTGSPSPLNVVSESCGQCGSTTGPFSIKGGKLLCSSCASDQVGVETKVFDQEEIQAKPTSDE